MEARFAPAPAGSPYTVQTTFVIPVTLITGINSTLPGKIFGQVSQDVYDTATGKHLLGRKAPSLKGSSIWPIKFEITGDHGLP